MNRRIIWGVPTALVVIGLPILLLACLQPTYTATVVEVGDRFYTPFAVRAYRTIAWHRE